MKKTSLSCLIICFSLFLSSCGMYSEEKAKEKLDNQKISIQDNFDVMDNGPVKGGVLKLFSTTPDTLNPILTNNSYVQDFLGLVFEGMVALGRDQKATPALADKWEVSSDGLIWTFHIRENVVWHNNMPVTAEDVKFTFDTIQNASIISVYKVNLQNIALYTAVDRNNFRIFLKKPYSFTPELMTFPVIPKHYFINDDVAIANSRKNMNPVGSGPYKFVKSQDTNLIRLIRNDKWKKPGAENDGKNTPYIDEINVKIFGSSKDEVSAMQTNDVDIAFIQSGDFGKYSGRPDLTIRKYISKNYDFITFNLENPILSDKAVRQAINLGVDRIKIVNELLAGQAVASEITVIPDTWLYDTSIISRGYDKDKAREILFQNGWKEDVNGLYKTIRGVNRYLNLELLVNDYNTVRYKVAENISNQLKELGINLSIKKVKWEDEFKQLQSKRFDMALVGWKVTSVPDTSFAFSSLEAKVGMNISGYKSSQVDSYLEQINKENDLNGKKVLFNNMKDTIMDDMPYLGLYFYNNAALINKRIKGEISPCIWNKYYDIEDWYISKGMQNK
jgi:peptide/nickel transport system substrate-binding protein